MAVGALGYLCRHEHIPLKSIKNDASGLYTNEYMNILSGTFLPTFNLLFVLVLKGFKTFLTAPFQSGIRGRELWVFH